MGLWFKTKSLLMLMISIISTFMLMFLSSKTIFHYDVNSFLEMPFSITLIVDTQSLIFISTVSTVSSIIIMYSFYYLSEESPYSMKKFLLTLMVFIMSMFILSVSANSFWLMVGWDGLGISSFCLIIFYQNWKSLGSGMVTFLSNRLGDTLIIVSMTWIILNQSTDAWMFPSFIFLLSLFMSIGAYSKSAQLPYLFWLPQAMAAPTPVSALVHSSTLVTAGIYLVCRFHPISSSPVSIFFFSISCATVLVAGTSSLMEFDLKKVIALSTLCHISLMMMFSVLGEIHLSLFHLMMHAFFKSLLFMIAGYIIHCNHNSQDIRMISIPKTSLSVSFPFLISISSMMGFPFLSGFYSKEALLMKSSLNLPSLLMMSMFLINSFFSCAYSTRLMTFLFSNHKKALYLSENTPFEPIFILGSLLSSFLGGLMILFILPEEESVQPLMIKGLLLITCVSGIVVGASVSMSPSLMIINPLTELWKSDFLYKIFQKHFFLSSNIYMWVVDEKGISKIIYSNMMKKGKTLFNSMSEFFLKEPFSLPKMIHFLIIALFWM
uniref:NADH dehydrogenase subunit 5 n=1 Tax=Brueelia antiqua TaxID=580326 RepID=UPI00211DE15E|nr:NADH dehydrogenase subunit 5 [Brueelia antiqua]UTT72549.1 NADH dehydrogenase subunit 5 [Brueelia antiqua]